MALTGREIFTNRPPSPVQAAVLDEITETMIEAHDRLAALLPDSAMKTLMVRKLEEASMWAKKAAVFTIDSEAVVRDRE